MYVPYVWVYVGEYNACTDQKRALDTLELEL